MRGPPTVSEVSFSRVTRSPSNLYSILAGRAEQSAQSYPIKSQEKEVSAQSYLLLSLIPARLEPGTPSLRLSPDTDVGATDMHYPECTQEGIYSRVYSRVYTHQGIHQGIHTLLHTRVYTTLPTHLGYTTTLGTPGIHYHPGYTLKLTGITLPSYTSSSLRLTGITLPSYTPFFSSQRLNSAQTSPSSSLSPRGITLRRHLFFT